MAGFLCSYFTQKGHAVGRGRLGGVDVRVVDLWGEAHSRGRGNPGPQPCTPSQLRAPRRFPLHPGAASSAAMQPNPRRKS